MFTLKPGLTQIKESTDEVESDALDEDDKITKSSDLKNNDSKITNLMDHEQCKDVHVCESSLLSDIISLIISQENNFILDVDMDFFSTQNPFKLLYTEVSIFRCVI